MTRFHILIGFCLLLLTGGCGEREQAPADSPGVATLRRLLVNPVDSSGNFTGYWLMMNTDVDTTSKPWTFNFSEPQPGKRTFAAFTQERIFAMNEMADSSYLQSDTPLAPVLGVDSYSLRQDSIIVFSAYTSPDRVKIHSLDAREMVLVIPGTGMPLKYKKVTFTKLK